MKLPAPKYIKWEEEEKRKTDKIPQKTTFTCVDTTGVLVSREEHVNVPGFTLSA